MIRVVSECCWRREWKRAVVYNYGTSVISFGEVLLRIVFNRRWHIEHHPAQLYLSNFTLCTRNGRKFWIPISEHQGGLSCNSTLWIRCYTSSLPNSNGGCSLQTSCPRYPRIPRPHFLSKKTVHCGCGWIWKRLAKIRWKMISQPILFEIPLSLQISLIQKKIDVLRVSLYPSIHSCHLLH